MNFKKDNFFGISLLASFISSMSLVAAQNLPGPADLGKVVTDLFNALFSNQAYYQMSSDVIARALIFFLLFVIIFIAVEKVFGDQKKGLKVILTLVVALLAVRYLTPEMVRGMFLPYEALGVTLSILIPFFILTGFLVSEGVNWPAPLKALCYYLLIGVFVSMWWLRWSEIGDLSWYYLVAAGITLATYFFSSSLENWLINHDVKDSSKKQILSGLADAEIKLKKLTTEVIEAPEGPGRDVKKAELKALKKAIDAIRSDYL